MRNYVFGGSFYPANGAEASGTAAKLIHGAKIEIRDLKSAAAYVVPHAGYAYSGATAAHTYKAMMVNKEFDSIDTIVIVGPNHTGLGEPVSVSMEDWNSPVGIAKNDVELSKAIASHSGISVDEDAHQEEHSIEVQLPFLLGFASGKKFCFICMGDQNMQTSIDVAIAIETEARKLKRNVIVLASSDMNHYESESITISKDAQVMAPLKRLDYEAFNAARMEARQSSCGYGPITVAAVFAKDSGCDRGVLLKYDTSATASKDSSSVVGYASFAFVRDEAKKRELNRLFRN